MKLLSPRTSLWIPSVCVAGIIVITIAPSLLLGRQYQVADLLPFLCFLPVIFMLIAQVNQRYFSRLERRIDELEQLLADKTAR